VRSCLGGPARPRFSRLTRSALARNASRAPGDGRVPPIAAYDDPDREARAARTTSSATAVSAAARAEDSDDDYYGVDADADGVDYDEDLDGSFYPRRAAGPPKFA
jgi:hypothetical protein